MCIIVAKQAGIEFPSNETLENCFRYNSDGAGIMFADNGEVQAIKGLQTEKAFFSVYEKIKRKYGRDTAFCFHFRIGTHGEKKSPHFTHPFPLSPDPKELKALKFSGNMGIMHNGIIYNYSRNTNSGLSDTMEFVADIAHPLLTKNSNALAEPNISIFSNILDGSRLCVMHGNGKIQLIGDFIKENEIYYSNDSYRKREISKIYTGKFSGYYPERSNFKCKYRTDCYLFGVECDLCTNADLYETMNYNSSMLFDDDFSDTGYNYLNEQ